MRVETAPAAHIAPVASLPSFGSFGSFASFANMAVASVSFAKMLGASVSFAKVLGGGRLYASMIKQKKIRLHLLGIGDPSLDVELDSFLVFWDPLVSGISVVMSGLALRSTNMCFLGGRGGGRSGAASVAPLLFMGKVLPKHVKRHVSEARTIL